jgi:ABC-type transport system involved in multi-copper enzyme maturation permease subunit
MKLFIIARHQMRLILKSPAILLLFVIAPIFMIYIFGQAFQAIFATSGQGIRAIDYFGATLLSLAIMQGTFIASWSVYKEKKSNTDLRLALAPIGKMEAAFGSFFGAWSILLALVVIVFFLARTLLSVSFGPSPLVSLLLFAAESFFVASLGFSLALIFKDERASGGILSALVPVFCLLGGGYVPIPESGFLHAVSVASPIRWINLALLEASRSGPNRYLAAAALSCALPAVALLILAGLRAGGEK